MPGSRLRGIGRGIATSGRSGNPTRDDAPPSLTTCGDDIMAKHSVTAIFDDRKQAELAVAKLRELGIPTSDVTLLPSADRVGTATAGERDDKGFWASLEDLFGGSDDRDTYAEGLRRGGTMVSVRAEDAQLDRVVDVLERHGSIDLDEREATWRREGWTGRGGLGVGSPGAAAMGASAYEDRGRTAATAPSAVADRAPAPRATATDDTVRVMEERLDIGKRTVSGGKVRIRTSVVEREASADVTLRQETVTVDRRAVDRPVGAGEFGADPFAERTIEIEEFEEQAVVGKTAYVVEEIALRKEASERVETVRDSVRSTKVDIEDDTGTASGLTGDAAGRIRPDMTVVGSDGAHVGTVDHMDGGRIKLKKDDAASGGAHHYLLPGLVRAVDGGTITLAVTAAEARARWTSAT